MTEKLGNIDEKRLELMKLFHKDPELAHRHLFPSRRENSTPPFHGEVIRLLHSTVSYIGLQAFRGGAKTTLAEETATLKALFSEHKYILVIGSTYTNACKILGSIRNELMSNPQLGELFGWQQSEPWSADTLVLRNGVRLEALGAGQAMRGIKFNEFRPSLAIIDDLEDDENSATDLARDKIHDWFWGTLFPALHPQKRQIIFIGTAIHPKSLIEKLFSDPEWICKRFPILQINNETGEEESVWPERFSIEEINKTRQMFYRQGRAARFAQEYLCRAEDEESKPFKANMIQVNSNIPKFAPRYIICDPARTINKKTSARTGYVCGACPGSRMIVEDAMGAFHMPDEIINTLFEWNEKYHPVAIGVESNSLEEFIRQPLRSEMIRRGITLPLVDLRAPNDKDAFIKSLQYFYKPGFVTHAKSLPDLDQELLSFPSGRKDVVNALAYLPTMRPGHPVYEDFTEHNITPILEFRDNKAKYLCISCRPAMTAASIVQYVDGQIRVYWSDVRDAPPQEAFQYIWRDAIQVGGDLKIASPQNCNEKSSLSGLPFAISKEGLRVQYTKDVIKSEGYLSSFIQKQVKGVPGLLINSQAKWAINGFLGGYCRKLEKDGSISSRTLDNEYQVLIEAIESFANWIDVVGQESYNGNRNYAFTKSGQKYITSRPK